FLQVAEIEVYGTATIVVPPTVSITSGSDGIVITYADGVLESADSLGGTWSAVQGASSPYSVNTGSGQQYYRVRQ
ncbi:MAG: hypothetical protein KIT22_14190, partial [Verrucomicrobiae bacterium]|nr:hypothetical protein [Verrucomicrobiae bacterium]